ncbi:MAG: VWA domain-containing protein, partial [FCB group bacterium]
MKKLLLFLVLLYLPLLCDAQSLTVFKVDTTAYPAVKAKFYAIDDQGYQITNLSPSNFTVLENGIQRTVTNVTCPAPKPPVALSSVLVIDVSGSMAGNGLNIAKAAATVWVNNSLSGKSECAITSFNDENYFNQDFTTDKQTLITAINNLQAGVGTDYNEALLNPVAGGIPAAKTGRYKKIIVMLTDGMPGYNPDINNIITQANQNQIAIYAVTLGFQAPDCLKQITTQTGGMWFENVTTEEQAKNVYLTILHTAQGGEPCEIDWTSKTVCQSDVKVEVSLDNPQLNAFANYTISKIAGLNFQPISIRFKDVPPGVKVDSIRTVKAIGGDFNISNINVSNPLFDINPKSFSLKQGDSTNLTISFTPADSTTQFCKFEFVNDVCPQYFYATGTYSFKPPVKPTIRITFPNGGEQFLAGSDTVITWEGVTPQDTISLEYSSNNGAAWHLITNRATGLKYNWSQLPNIAGSQYLIRGKLKERDTQNLKDTMVLGMGTIETIALSGDGKYLATGGSSGRVYLWDFVTGTLLKSFTGHTGEIRSLTFSPDGNTIASAGWDKTIILWNVITGKRLNTLTGHVSGVNSVAYSPDGTIIASGSDDANIKIWDVNTGTNINTLTGHSNPVRTVAFSHDGLTLASGSTDNTVKLWDIKNKNIKNTLFCGNSIGVYSVVFSPDNKSLASSTGWGYIFIWDVKSGILKDTLIGHTQGVTSIIYSPDGRTLFSGSWDDTIKVWNVDSSSVIKNLTGHKSGVIAIALSADGLLLASGSIDNSIKIWDMNSGNNIKTLTGYTSRLFSIAISPDGKTVATGDINNNINIWDLNTGILLKSLPHGGVNWITSLAYSPDGNILASGNTDSVITLWDIKNGIIKDSLIENVWLGNGCIISFSPDGSKLASGQDNTARIWDLQSRTIIKTFNHTSTISTVSFSPDGRTLASGGWFAKIRFFDVNLGIEVKTFIESSFINSIAFRPDGSMLVSGNDNKEIKLWDVNSGTTLKTINGHKRAVNTVAFSPDGTTVASGSGDMTIKLWDVNSGDSLKTLYGHADVVNSIAYNPDGTKLASGSYDGTCIVWNLDSTKTIQSDTSDSPFSIIVPQGRSSDIDMGKVLIGSTKDSVVQAFIQNLSTFPLTIKNVSIIGTDTSDFKVNTGV